jgi:hypothetical protein
LRDAERGYFRFYMEDYFPVFLTRKRHPPFPLNIRDLG